MSFAPRLRPGVFLVALTLSPSPIRAGEMRADIEGLAVAIENAVSRVSRPTRFGLPGQRARGYHLPSYGAVFVLSPRALPRPKPVSKSPDGEGALALAEAARRLEDSLKRLTSDETRRQIEENIRALRDAEVDLRRRERTRMGEALSGPTVHSEAEGEAEVAEKDLELLDQELSARLALHIPPRRHGGRVPRKAEQGVQLELDREMLALHEQVEVFRLEAERARVEAETEILEQVEAFRLGAEKAQAGAEKARLEAEKDVLERLDAGRLEGGSAPTGALSPPTPAPGLVWRDVSEGEDTRSGEEVIEQVRISVTGVLEAEGWRLRELRSTEVIAVAVDFVRSGKGLRARPARTLLVRVTKKAVEERHSGRISAGEFREHTEVVEY